MFKEVFVFIFIVVVLVAIAGSTSYDATMGRFTPHTFSKDAYVPGKAMNTEGYTYQLIKGPDGKLHAVEISHAQ